MSHSSPNKPIKLQLKEALACRQQGNPAKAQWLFQQILAVDPYQAQALEGLGLLHGEAGRLEEALNCFARAAIASPNEASLQLNTGKVLKELGRDAEALTHLDKAIALDPKFAEAYDTRGIVLNKLERYDEALASFDRAIACKKNFASAHNNRGALLLGEFGRRDEALASFNRAIALIPGFADACYNRAHLLHESGQYDEAALDYDKAIRLNPGSAKARYNKGLLKLLLGEYGEGWSLYEWRWQTEQFRSQQRQFNPDQLWQGQSPLPGKTILIHAEQGFGDMIQMARYVPLLEAQGAKVILEAPAALMPLLRTLKASVTLIEKGATPPAFDLHCPVMSLPLAFGTTVDTIPATAPYLGADPQKQAEVRARLGARQKLTVGLAWSGNPKHLNDHNRSMALATLAPLLALDIEFHSLQKEVRPEDVAALTDHPCIHTHGDEFHDYADTAALIAELDLVITVDTSVAHLAGALGKPVWVLLPEPPDFRWLLSRSDSPWYPTARLFRRQRDSGWESVVSSLRQELESTLLTAG